MNHGIAGLIGKVKVCGGQRCLGRSNRVVSPTNNILFAILVKVLNSGHIILSDQHSGMTGIFANIHILIEQFLDCLDRRTIKLQIFVDFLLVGSRQSNRRFAKEDHAVFHLMGESITLCRCHCINIISAVLFGQTARGYVIAKQRLDICQCQIYLTILGSIKCLGRFDPLAVCEENICVQLNRYCLTDQFLCLAVGNIDGARVIVGIPVHLRSLCIVHSQIIDQHAACGNLCGVGCHILKFCNRYILCLCHCHAVHINGIELLGRVCPNRNILPCSCLKLSHLSAIGQLNGAILDDQEAEGLSVGIVSGKDASRITGYVLHRQICLCNNVIGCCIYNVCNISGRICGAGNLQVLSAGTC